MRKKYFHNTFVVYECAGIKTNQSTTQKEKEDYQDFNFIAVFEKKIDITQNYPTLQIKMNPSTMICKLIKMIAFVFLKQNDLKIQMQH